MLTGDSGPGQMIDSYQITTEHEELWRRRAFASARPWSPCAIAACALIVPVIVGEILLLGLPVVSPDSCESRGYQFLVAWAVLLVPIQSVGGIVLGCLGSAQCRSDLRVRGTPLAVVSIIAAFLSFIVWYSTVCSVFLSSERLYQGLAVLAVIGVAWALADRSRAGRWAAASVLIVVVLGPVIPKLIAEREAARVQQIKSRLKSMGIKIQLQHTDTKKVPDLKTFQ